MDRVAGHMKRERERRKNEKEKKFTLCSLFSDGLIVQSGGFCRRSGGAGDDIQRRKGSYRRAYGGSQEAGEDVYLGTGQKIEGRGVYL